MSNRGRRAFVLLPLLLILILGISTTGFAQDGIPQRGEGTVDPAFAGQVQRLRDSGIDVSAEQLGRQPFIQSALPTGQIQVNVELIGEPAALVFARAGGQGGGAGAIAAAQAQASNLASEQAQFISSLPSFGINTQVLAQTQYVVNMVTLVVNASEVEALRARADVKGVYPVRYFERDTSSSMQNIGAPSAWDGSLGGEYLGEGVVISIIDSGIDYTHTHFGGNGDFSLSATYPSRNVIGDDPNFPGPKVIGGYDFAGDLYGTVDDFPTPDPDPADCPISEGFVGHGTHVAGIAAGYGVKSDGTTFGNPGESYDNLPAGMLIGPGAAPMASLLAMKVFGCDGGTGDFVVVQAIDASVSGQYGGPADIINMSLGSAFGGAHDDPNWSIYVTAVNSAVSAGVTVVASAGNSYDTWFITGSPGSTPAIIAVASTSDGGEDGVLIDGTLYPSRDSVNAVTSIVGPAGFTYLPGTGCTADQWASFPANSFAVLNWTGACGSIGIATAAAQATPNLPLGVLIANNVPVALQNLSCFSSNPAAPYIPCVSIQQSTGQFLAANLGAQITFDPNLTAVNAAAVDTISGFSSRGPASFAADGLGPDIAAPGDVVTSAGAGTGIEPYSIGGTSMAAPTVAGVAALVLSNPFYANLTPYQMKALLMNTANADVYLSNNQTGPRIAPQRMGSGRVSVPDAMQSEVIAFNRLRPDHVAVSFLYPEVTFGGTATFTKEVRIQNLGMETATYDLSIDVYSNANLAQFSVSPSSVTVGPRASVDVVVTLTVDTNVVNTQNFSDTSVSATQGGLPRHFLSEEGANLIFTPTSGATIPLRVPLYAAPRATSEMYISQPGAADDGMFGFTVVSPDGVPLSDPGPTLREAPISLGSVFQLVGTDAIGDTISPASNADIEYVGIASNYLWGGSNPDGSWNADGVVWVALATAGDWNTPQNTIFDIYLDTDLDGSFNGANDVNVYNWTITENNQRTDVHLSVAGRLGGTFFLNEFINGTSASIDTYVMNNNVMFLAFYPTVGGTLTTSQFNMYVDVFDRETNAYVDTTPVFSVDLANPLIDTWSQILFGDALISDEPDFPVFLDYNLSDALPGTIPTALVLHHHNDSNTTNPTTGQNFRRAELVYITPDTVDLGIYKLTSDEAESYAPGSTLTYELGVFAFSQGDSTEFMIEDVLSPELTFISASPACSHTGEAQGGTVTCFDTISTNENKTYEITVSINPLFVGTISNTATITPDAIEEFPSDNVSTYVITVPPMATTITAPIGETADNTPLFVWDEVVGSDWYQLFVSADGSPVFNQWYDATAVCAAGTCSVDAGVVHPAGNYEAVVQTWHPTGGFGPFSNTALYTVTTPPAAPTLIAPLGEIAETNPLFTYSMVDAGWYQIWITNNTAGGVLVHQDVYEAAGICGAGECALDASLSLEAGNYSWWVRGWNQWGLYGDWSSTGNFTVAVAPVTPTPIAPIGDIGTGMPTFEWTESPTSTWYQIWLSDGVSPVMDQWYDGPSVCVGGTCSATPGLDLSTGTYSWWVRSWSPLGGYSAWSSETLFTVVIPPAAPILTAPIGTIASSNPLFTFERDASATWFYLWLSDGENPVLVDWFDGAAVCAGTTCSIDAGVSLTAGDYIWWVQAWSPVGGYSTWSAAALFEVSGGGGGGAETTPEPVAPADPTDEPAPVDEVTPTPEPTPTEEVTPEPTEEVTPEPAPAEPTDAPADGGNGNASSGG